MSSRGLVVNPRRGALRWLAALLFTVIIGLISTNFFMGSRSSNIPLVNMGHISVPYSASLSPEEAPAAWCSSLSSRVLQSSSSIDTINKNSTANASTFRVGTFRSIHCRLSECPPDRGICFLGRCFCKVRIHPIL